MYVRILLNVWTVLQQYVQKVRRWLQNKNNTRLDLICDSYDDIYAFSLPSVFYVVMYGRRKPFDGRRWFEGMPMVRCSPARARGHVE